MLEIWLSLMVVYILLPTPMVHGTELWKSDGTTAGTVSVKEIYGGVNNSSNPQLLTNCGNYLLFTATDGINGYEMTEQRLEQRC